MSRQFWSWYLPDLHKYIYSKSWHPPTVQMIFLITRFCFRILAGVRALQKSATWLLIQHFPRGLIIFSACTGVVTYHFLKRFSDHNGKRFNLSTCCDRLKQKDNAEKIEHWFIGHHHWGEGTPKRGLVTHNAVSLIILIYEKGIELFMIFA